MIVAAGDAIVDLFALPLGSPVDAAESFAPCAGGASANMVTAAARLGARARFVGGVGRDAHGERLLRGLHDAGVDTQFVSRHSARTGVTFVHVEPGGARSFLAYRHAVAPEAPPPSLAPREALEGARWLHLCTSALATEPLSATVRALRAHAVQRGTSLSVDLNVRMHQWPSRAAARAAVDALTEGVAVLKASEEDLDALGLPPTLAGLCALTTAKTLAVLTLAERGCVARLGEREWRVAAPAVALQDATGAGDAFCGALVAALDGARGARGLAAADDTRWEPWLACACAVGALAVTRVGATTALGELREVRGRLEALARGTVARDGG